MKKQQRHGSPNPRSAEVRTAYLLSDAPPRIVIHCDTCSRHGDYSRDRAIASLGDIALPTFLTQTVGAVCSRKRDIVNFAGCGAVFADEVIEALGSTGATHPTP